MARRRGAKKCCNPANLSINTIILVLGALMIIIGLTMTLRESWSSPSRHGGRTSGSNPGLAPWGPHKPPHSDRSLLLPSPSYEYSLDVAHNVATNGVQEPSAYQHLNEPNVLSFLPHHARRHPLRDVAPLAPPNSMNFARSHANNEGLFAPLFQRFFVKNRLGDPSFSVRPDLAIPSFAPGPEWQRVGIIYKPNHPDLKLPLFGRPKYPGGNRFDYYVLDDSRHENPLPLDDHNGLELVSGDVVRIPGYEGDFFVYNYSYDAGFIGDQR